MHNLKHGNFAFKTDIGKIRVTNEDQVIVLSNKHGNILMAVADGMGGHARGDIASKLAIKSLINGFESTFGLLTTKTASLWLRSQVIKANRLIYQEAQKSASLKEMGTTLVVIVIVRNEAIMINIGDSRIYQLDQGVLTQLTEDQTYVDYLYRQGKITYEEMLTHPQKHVLLNALGLNPSVSYDQKIIPYTGQKFLACSDGLYNNVSDQEIRAIMQTSDHPQQKVDTLINLANAHGGNDNIAVAIWESMT
jgi:PPM family protein phosphatase